MAIGGLRSLGVAALLVGCTHQAQVIAQASAQAPAQEAAGSPPPPPVRAPLVVRADQPKHAIPRSLWGIFFEEINHAGEGGLLAELLRNRSFEEPPADGADAAASIPGWFRGDGALLERTTGPHASAPTAVRLHGRMHSEGHFGIAVRAQERLNVRLDAKRVGEVVVTIALETRDGRRIAEVKPDRIGEAWGSTMDALVPTETCTDARFVVSTEGSGDLHIDLLSLTPASTWRGHGLRNDLAELIADLKPAFVRFPGGCYVEGGDLLRDAFRWPTTVGDIATRPGHRNAAWGYWSTDGLGFHEYLQWCEDLGAEPLFVVNCGLSHKESVPLDQLGPWIQEALDALEYANGSQETRLGAMRADNGHPAPFGLRLIEIGNENGMFGDADGTFGGSRSQYTERYKAFHAAIRAKHPDVAIIANTRIDAPADFIDDHFYNTPGWFWQNAGMYDRVDRRGTPIYVGEFAVTQGCGLGNLDAALAEAAFMTGLERNSDLVRMASYAPLLVHTRDRRWNPDLIVFDQSRAYGTPSYWVQALFAQYRAERLLPVELPPLPLTQPTGSVGIGAWNTEAEFMDITLTLPGESPRRIGDVPYRESTGPWQSSGGVHSIRSAGEGHLAIFELPELAGVADYTLSLKARKLAGREGFLIAFHAANSKELTWWNIGGWDNSLHAIERTSGGRVRLGTGVPVAGPGGGPIETNRWYDLIVECKDGRARCLIDGRVIHDLDVRQAARVAAVAGRVETSGDLIVKIVNGTEAPLPLALAVREAAGDLARFSRGEIVVLTGPTLAAENTFDSPTAIAPRRQTMQSGALPLSLECAPRSLTIVRLSPAE